MINKDEILDVVDENNNVIGQASRKDIHSKKLLHRVSHIWIVNGKNQILVQRRSLLKDTSPGKWEPFFGGHLNSGVEYLEGAKTEVKEELGLEVVENNLKLWKIYKNEEGDEFQGVFVYKWDGASEEIKFEEEEVSEIKWMDLNEVSKLVLSTQENNWSKMGYEKELLKFVSHLNKA